MSERTQAEQSVLAEAIELFEGVSVVSDEDPVVTHVDIGTAPATD